MDNSIVLARIFGVVFLVCGLEAVFNRKFMSAALGGVADSPISLWIAGLIFLLMGGTVVALQNVWSPDWRVIITIIGWGSVLKGACIMLFSDFMRTVYRKSNVSSILTFGGIVAVLLGLFLLYMALTQ